MISQTQLSGFRVDGVSNTDGSIGEDVSAKSATVDQPTQDTLCRETFQVSTGLAQPLSKALDIANSKPSTHKAVEIDTPGDQIAPSLFVRKPTTTRQH